MNPSLLSWEMGWIALGVTLWAVAARIAIGVLIGIGGALFKE